MGFPELAFPRRRMVRWCCWGVLGQLLALLLAVEGLVSLLRLFRAFPCFWFVCPLVEQCFCLFPMPWWGMVFFPCCSWLLCLAWILPPGVWGQVEPAYPIGEGGYGALFFRFFQSAAECFGALLARLVFDWLVKGVWSFAW